MIKYDKYKDSGVDWLGDIPEQWEIVKAKDISKKIGDGLHGTPEYTDNQQYHFINGNNLNNGRIDLTGSRTISFEEYKKLEIRFSDQTLLLSINGTIGNISFFNNEFIALGKSVAYIELKPNFNKCFFYYLLLTNSILDFFELELTGTTIKNLSLKTIRNTLFVFPPLHEQSAIATYLDSKTSAIDRKVALLEQKITHYQQLRKSLINETVCRGLNKTVRLKYSGIEWIGEIPEHWEVKRMKDLSKSMGSGATPLSNIPSYYENGILNWVNTGDLNDGSINDCQYMISQHAINDYPNLKTNKKGTLLIAMYGATICKIGLLNIEAATNQACCCINFKKEHLSKYVFYWFLANKNHIISLSVGGTQPNISQGIISKLLIGIPPLSEQVAIATYLNEKTQKIDSIVSNIKTQIETLKELRKTLINDVVTGKIKVTP